MVMMMSIVRALDGGRELQERDVNIWEWEYDDGNEMRKMGPEESRGGAEEGRASHKSEE